MDNGKRNALEQLAREVAKVIYTQETHALNTTTEVGDFGATAEVEVRLEDGRRLSVVIDVVEMESE